MGLRMSFGVDPVFWAKLSPDCVRDWRDRVWYQDNFTYQYWWLWSIQVQAKKRGAPSWQDLKDGRGYRGVLHYKASMYRGSPPLKWFPAPTTMDYYEPGSK